LAGIGFKKGYEAYGDTIFKKKQPALKTDDQLNGAESESLVGGAYAAGENRAPSSTQHSV
jgi:hypothetical protein